MPPICVTHVGFGLPQDPLKPTIKTVVFEKSLTQGNIIYANWVLYSVDIVYAWLRNFVFLAGNSTFSNEPAHCFAPKCVLASFRTKKFI